ncbi:hypothetical protein [Lolliginicoccus levis]|uniref:hypothetical protein n=1 Tax=Lolliginicoccus levis TaxID=2919542 RepID=UPI00241EBC5F|nr:hypothetical protein [Lolliginicoccus levis]
MSEHYPEYTEQYPAEYWQQVAIERGAITGLLIIFLVVRLRRRDRRTTAVTGLLAAMIAASAFNHPYVAFPLDNHVAELTGVYSISNILMCTSYSLAALFLARYAEYITGANRFSRFHDIGNVAAIAVMIVAFFPAPVSDQTTTAALTGHGFSGWQLVFVGAFAAGILLSLGRMTAASAFGLWIVYSPTLKIAFATLLAGCMAGWAAVAMTAAQATVGFDNTRLRGAAIIAGMALFGAAAVCFKWQPIVGRFGRLATMRSYLKRTGTPRPPLRGLWIAAATVTGSARMMTDIADRAAARATL